MAAHPQGMMDEKLLEEQKQEEVHKHHSPLANLSVHLGAQISPHTYLTTTRNPPIASIIATNCCQFNTGKPANNIRLRG